jgi:hypothetical protein
MKNLDLNTNIGVKEMNLEMKLFILFLICPLSLFSQIKITGQVFDRETKEPIPNVVVYTNDNNKITLTDDKGHYVFEINSSEPVYFRQLAYDFLETTSDLLHTNPTIYLTRNVVELGEVVISPVLAQDWINKAIQNLNLRLQKKTTKSYLFHIEETTTTGGERNMYALIGISLNKINSLTGFYHWNFDLLQLDKIKAIKEDDFYLKKKPFRTELFPHKMTKYTDLNDFIFEFQDNNEEQLIIKVSPKHPDKKHYKYFSYAINRRDTVLTEIIAQSYSNSSELTLRKFKDIRWYLSNHHYRIKFVQDETSGLYYIKELQNLVVSKVISPNFSYDISMRETVSTIEQLSIQQTNTKKKIKPYDYVLFETDFLNSPNFWKQYIK